MFWSYGVFLSPKSLNKAKVKFASLLLEKEVHRVEQYILGTTAKWVLMIDFI